ncbi:MAG: putative DNA binding domain-containing protein [Oscillospiraceae bacterium]|nr:putative DNA binding domain-containing protein [Oscillospiraceae bacterium]
MPFEHDSIISIVRNACKSASEYPWIELKENNADPQQIGEYVSSLSNTAALYRQNYGFMIWGVNDSTHKIVGTQFYPEKKKKGGQSLILWISTLLKPRMQIYFHEVEIENEHIVVLEIAAANSVPVAFSGTEYVRIGTNKVKLMNFPDTERQLWAIFSEKSYDEIIALDDLNNDTVLSMLDYRSYYEKLNERPPSSEKAIIERLIDEKIVIRNNTGSYGITNIGALFFAHRLSDFSNLARKAIRIISYNGEGKAYSSSREVLLDKGYVNGFEDLITYIYGLIPDIEDFSEPIRKDVPVYPEDAVRELMGNLIIHQDFFMRGTGPMVEIYKSRMEVTNPGAPLIEKDRFVDHSPVSRNETMAGLLRRFGIGEERGVGFDKIVIQTELYKLPPPEIIAYSTHTKVILHIHKTFANMSKSDRRLACYYHACIKWVYNSYMTNASLRERFGIEEKNKSMISRLLKDACEAGLIKINKESLAEKSRKYEPYWA